MTILSRDFVLQQALDMGMLSPAQLEAARAVVNRQPPADSVSNPVLHQLLADGVLTPEQILDLQAAALRLEVVDLSAIAVDREVLVLVPRELAARHGLLPIRRTGLGVLVAVSDPLSAAGPDSLVHLLGCGVEIVLAPASEIMCAIGRWYGENESKSVERGGERAGVAMAAADSGVSSDLGGEPEPAEENDAPIIQAVHRLIAEAVEQRASDIHLEPLANRFRVRYRIDGALVEVEGPPRSQQAAVISRVKLMANISIAEKRVPQDGRIQLPHGRRRLDLRVSSLPTAHGESVVMRVLDRESVQPGLAELGFSSEDRALVERLIALPDGIVLVTGPTGSGKTTTLYGCLHHLNQPDRKIITVEDPVEYQLSGVNQVAVRAETGLTFAAALRAMLRQAPNVVMVGEIRDLETAEMAIHASLTGHMVFSTLHTNDAPGAVARLVDLGVKPFLLATSLRAVVAQRLVRKVCLQCRQAYRPTAAEFRSLGLDPARAGEFVRGAGCPVCHGTGYRGRLGLFEIFVINDEIQQLIHERLSPVRLRALARSRGLRTLREDGARKVSAGLTTIEEVVSITVGDAS